jgi:gas vesicle protein
MGNQDTTDFLTAFAIGAVLGIGATLLLRPDSESEAERILRQIRPLRKKATKRMRQAGRSASRRVRGAGVLGEDVVAAGRAAIGDFRDEAAGIVEAARDEILRAARDSVKQARGAVERGLKRR